MDDSHPRRARSSAPWSTWSPRTGGAAPPRAATPTQPNRYIHRARAGAGPVYVTLELRPLVVLVAVGPLEGAVFVGLVGHRGLHASFRHLGLERRPNDGVLVGILDLVARQVGDPLGVAARAARRVERQVAARALAHVEVLVEP